MVREGLLQGARGRPTATDKEITRAYRKLAKQYHPDANPGSEERFKEISAAYDVLGDADKRKEYDEVRRLGPGRRLRRRRRGRRAPSASRTWATWATSSGACSGPAAGRRPSAARSGAPTWRPQLHLSFLDAVHGVTTSVNVPAGRALLDLPRQRCGAGHVDAHLPPLRRAGSLNDNQGLFSFSPSCPDCVGRGTLVDTPCPICHGTGTRAKVRSIKVRIPAGVEDGQRIRVKGRGAPGQGMAPPGDLYVVVHVGQHPVFGAHRAQPHPHGADHLPRGGARARPSPCRRSTARSPSRSRPGRGRARVLRVRGRGVPGASGRNGGKPGDLLVTIEVVVPTELSDEQRAAVEALAAVTEAAPRDDGGVVTDAPRPELVRDANRAVYVISVAAELAGVHPQTLRIYERKGLLDPARTGGGSRRFCERDLDRLRHIQELTATGLNLEGVRRVLELEAELARLRERARGRAGGRARRGRGDAPPVPARPGAGAPVSRCRTGPGGATKGEATAPGHENERRPDERDGTMAIDPERWTNKTKAAFSAATGHAASSNNPEVTPAHLLDALLQQPETMTRPLLSAGRGRPRRAGGQGARPAPAPAPGQRRRRAGALARRPRRPRGGGPEPPRPGRRLRLGRAPPAGPGRPDRRDQGRAVDRAAERAGQPPGHHGRPRADLPGAGQVRPGPDRGGPRRASSTRSSAATRRSAGSSRCCRAAPRTTRC